MRNRITKDTGRQWVSVSADGMNFLFSGGTYKKGRRKFVQFSRIGESSVFNLGFGNLLTGDTIDLKTKVDYDMHDKALSIVAAIVYEFTARYPQRQVFFAGSDRARTRLFRKVLSAYLD